MSVRWCAMRTQGAAALALGCAVQLGFQPALISVSIDSFLSLPQMAQMRTAFCHAGEVC